MDITPLEYRVKQESLFVSMKKVHASDVYQKAQMLRQMAKQRGPRPTQASGSLCTHQKQSVTVPPKSGGELPSVNGQRISQQGKIQGFKSRHGEALSSGRLSGDNKVQSSQYPISNLQSFRNFQISSNATFTDILEDKINKPPSPVGQLQNPIGLHLGNNQSLAAVHKEYSHFQNQTLKELADSRTMSVDQNQVLKSGQEEIKANTLDVEVKQETSGNRYTILSRRENVKKGYPAVSQQQDNFQFSRGKGSSSNEKRSYVQAEIIESLKSGYGFKPNFSQPNNQGPRVKRTVTKRNSSDMRIFARSPGAVDFNMELSPQGKKKTQTIASKRPTQAELPENSQEIINNITNEKQSQNASMTDQASQMTPNDYHQFYKYSSTEDYAGIVPHRDSSSPSQERAPIFNSQSLYDRYNKMINLTIPKNGDDGSPSERANATIQNQNVVSEKIGPSHYNGANNNKNIRKKNQSESQRRHIQNTKENDGGHLVTIVVIQDQKQGNKKYAKSQERKKPLSPSICIRKLTSRGVPICNVSGRLKSLRLANSPAQGLVQINFPITRQSTLLNSQADRSIINSKMADHDASKETQKGKKHSAQFAIIKDIQQAQLITDTLSEGTNRMSATQIKLRQSKVSSLPINCEQMSPSSPQENNQKVSVVTFEQLLRRSLEFKQIRSSSVMGSDLRNQTKSKSIDSGGAVSNAHDMLKPKGIEGFQLQQSFGASDVDTPKNKGLNILATNKQRLSDIIELKKDQHQSHAQLDTFSQRGMPQELLDKPKDFVLMTLDERGLIVPRINIDHVKSGEVITANLNSSNSERAIQMMKDKSLSASVKQFNESSIILKQFVNLESQSSIISSIKTSIDDETLMNLAQKGICALTPVVKYSKASRLKVQNQTVVDPKDTSFSAYIASHANHLIPPQNTLISVISPLETPQESNGNDVHLNSTYQQVEGAAMGQDRIASAQDLMNIVEQEDQSHKQKGSNRKIVASKQSLRNVIFQQSLKTANLSNLDMPSNQSIQKPTIINIGTLDTPINGGESQSKPAQDITTSNRAEDQMTFSSQAKNIPVKRAEMEAMSQTDFAPLPPLDHPAFSIQNISGNYDMFVDGFNNGSLQDFSMTGHLTSLGAIQTDSIMEQAIDKEVLGTSVTQKIGTRQKILYGANFMQLYPPQSTLLTSINETRNQTGMKDPNSVMTENLQIATTPVAKLASPKRIKNVVIETARILAQSLQIDGSPAKTMQKDQNLEAILQAASQGKRVICKNINGDPDIINQRPEEQVSSPKSHHLLALTGKPLQAVNLKERNRLKNVMTMKKLSKYNRRGKLKLSKDFKALTRNVMMEKHLSQGIEGIDKSIGEETSHSAGSFTKKRNYYILNIDNTKEDEINLATYKPSQSPDAGTPVPEERSNINSMLSRQYATIVEQKSKKELERDGIVTDRNFDSSNEQITSKKLLAFPSARNNQRQSRHEDLETVYMQSTMQFNKEIPINNYFLSYNKTSKSPEPFIGVKDFTKNKSNLIVDKIDENLRGQSKEAGLTQKKALPTLKQLSQVSIERRQIQLKNSYPNDSRQSSVTQVQGGEQIMSLRSSLQKTGLSSLTHDVHIGNGKVRMQSNVMQELASPKEGGMIQIKDESGQVPQRNEKAQTLEKSLLNSQRNGNRDISSGDRTFNSVNRTKENSDSGGSREKLYVPVAAIKVGKIRSSLHKVDLKRSSQPESKKSRPKTVENSQGRDKEINVVPDSPRSRKIIYLMHKRRQIALRSRVRQLTHMSDPDPHDLKILPTHCDSNGPKPSFFDALSQQMSKVFSLDNTSTQVVTTMAKNTQANRPQIHQSWSQEKTSQSKKGNDQNTNKQIQLQLTINPCSNTSLVQTHRNPVSLRQNKSTYGDKLRGRNLHINITSAIISHAQQSPILKNRDQAFAANSKLINMLQIDNLNAMDRNDQPLFDTFLASRQQQRAGLKTAEGRQRGKNLSKIVDQIKTNAVMSNQSIDLQNKFKGFDRRQTHDKIFSQEYNTGPISQESQFVPAVMNSFSQRGGNQILTNKSKPAMHTAFETSKRAENTKNIQIEHSRETSTQKHESAFGNLKEMTLYEDTFQETPIVSNLQNKNPNSVEVIPLQTKSYSFQKRCNQTLINVQASYNNIKETQGLQEAVHSNSQPKNGVPLMHTQSRKQARLLKQEVIYQRNQRLKQIVIEEQNNEKKLKISALIDSISSSIYNLTTTI